MTFLIFDAANSEILEACDYYDRESKSLGTRFLHEIDLVFKEIEFRPQRRPEIAKDIRRWNLASFPYGVNYRFANGTITIGFVMHGRRRPRYWKNRFEDRKT